MREVKCENCFFFEKCHPEELEFVDDCEDYSPMDWPNSQDIADIIEENRKDFMSSWWEYTANLD